MKACPGCNFPLATPARSIACEGNGAAGLVVLCARCDTALNRLPPNKARTRALAACAKALSQPERYGVVLFPDMDDAVLACGLFGHPDYAGEVLDMLSG